MNSRRSQRHEQLTRIPLTIFSLIFLALYAWPILDTGLSDTTRSRCAAAGTVIWVVFIADFVIRLGVAEHRRLFLRHNWLDLLLVALPMLRPLRALRGVVGLRIVGQTSAPFARRRVVAATDPASLAQAQLRAGIERRTVLRLGIGRHPRQHQRLTTAC